MFQELGLTKRMTFLFFGHWDFKNYFFDPAILLNSTKALMTSLLF